MRHPTFDLMFERPSESWLFSGDEAFVVATVVSVRDSGATNASPPTVVIRVQDVLRGRVPRREIEIEWPTVPLYMPCAVGEGETIRRWNEAPLRGPGVGKRMILGLIGGPCDAHVCRSDAYLRWDDTGVDSIEVRRKIAAWTPNVEARQKREREEAVARAKRDRAAREKTERVLVETERAKLAIERSLRQHADVGSLVRWSDAIVVTSAPVLFNARTDMKLRFAHLAPRTWLLDTGHPDWHADSLITLAVSQREDTLLARWKAMPPDDRPGSAEGRPLTCVAFLRYAREADPTIGAPRMYRPVDPLHGILWADERLLDRIRQVVATRADDATDPAPGCGAGLTEFEVATEAEAEAVGLKLTRIRSASRHWSPQAIILGSGFGVGDFGPCARPQAMTPDELVTTWLFRTSPAEMKALLDSLVNSPVQARARTSTRDTVALSLVRSGPAGPRVFETTLDANAMHVLFRQLAAIFRERSDVRANMDSWWGGIDPALVNPPAPPPQPRFAFAGTAPAPDRGKGSVMGWFREFGADAALSNVTVRTLDPRRTVVTDPEGGFELRNLPPGDRWFDVRDADWKLLGGGMFEVHANVIDTIVVRMEIPNGSTPSPPEPPDPEILRAAVAESMRRAEEVLEVRVVSSLGEVIPGAYVSVERESIWFAGVTDASGAWRVEDLPLGPIRFLVRAPGYETLRVPISFKGHSAGPIELGVSGDRRWRPESPAP